MTNTEAKKILESYIACESKKAHFECSEYNCDDSCPLLYEMGTVGEFNEAINMGIKALEQEPCEDAISKRAVNILVDELARAISDERCCMSRGRSTATIMQDILDLSSVKPQERTGHWEEVGEEYIQVYDLNGIPSCGDERICSECGFETVFIGEHCSQYKFCPHCGAKMEVEQNG